VLVVAGVFVWRHHVSVREARTRASVTVDEIFVGLRQRGFEPNPLFAGRLLPGTILQLREAGPTGASRPLTPPLVMFWGDRCFPGLAPSAAPIAIETHSGSTRAQLSLAGDLGRAVFPALVAGDAAVAEQSLVLGATELLSVAKGDISGHMAPECVDGLTMHMSHGAQQDWFGVVVESVVTRKISYEVKWSSSASADAKMSVRKQAEEGLGRLAAAGAGPAGKGTLSSDEVELTVVNAEGTLVLAYRVRTLDPIYAQAGRTDRDRP
jgi:hypothetical protein